MSTFLPKAVAIDITTFASAQEHLLAHKARRPPLDPFADDAYRQIVMAAVYVGEISVLHPRIPPPEPTEWGDDRRLLLEAFAQGLARPLVLSPPQEAEFRSRMRALVDVLQGEEGMRALHELIDAETAADREVGGPAAAGAFERRLQQWVQFQTHQVTDHAVRVGNPDGATDDEVGEWSRHATHAHRRRLADWFGDDRETLRWMDAVARGARYQIQAESALQSYFPHHVRAAFVATIHAAAAERPDQVGAIVKKLRGVTKDPDHGIEGMDFMDGRLSLIGGRVWSGDEIVGMTKDAFLRLVVERLVELRSAAKPLREDLAEAYSAATWAEVISRVESVYVAALRRQRELTQSWTKRRVRESTVQDALQLAGGAMLSGTTGGTAGADLIVTATAHLASRAFGRTGGERTTAALFEREVGQAAARTLRRPR